MDVMQAAVMNNNITGDAILPGQGSGESFCKSFLKRNRFVSQ